MIFKVIEKYYSNNLSSKTFKVWFYLLGYRACDTKVVEDKVDSLKYAFYELQEISKKRHEQLEESRKLYLFFDACAEEDDWLEEQVQQVNSQDCGKDLASTLSLVTKHSVGLKDSIE